jgi:hypothetical protein
MLTQALRLQQRKHLVLPSRAWVLELGLLLTNAGAL